jgi:hypothetical protein
MLMIHLLYGYANSFPELRPKVAAVGLGPSIVGAEGLRYDTIDLVPGEQQSKIRALVLGNRYTYGAAAWYVATSCTPDTLARLATGGFGGFEHYAAKCLYAVDKDGKVDARRVRKWCYALKVLAPAGMEAPGECAGLGSD